MRAGEDPGNTVPGNKTAREQGFARLVQLLHEMKKSTLASTGLEGPMTAGRAGDHPVVCHDAAAAAGGASM
jgi:carboxymethylenebutenolidase